MAEVKKARDPFIDNARFILIFLVVLGHFFVPIRGDHPFINEINNILGLFRMPALILLTGFLSKGFMKPGFIKKIIMKLLVPYFIFQVIFGVYYYFLYNDPTYEFYLLSPQFTLWFLLSLFFWNLMLFVFTKIKYPILIAIILGVGVGYFSDIGHYLSMHRTFVFFPFFLLGYYMKLEHLKWVKKRFMKVAAVAAFVFVYIMFEQVLSLNESLNWLFGYTPYAGLGYDQWYAGFFRLAIYGLSLIVGFAFLAFVPTRETFFTEFGKRTAYIYILHGVIVETMYEIYLYEAFSNVWDYMLILVYGVIITLTLGSNRTVQWMRPLIEGRIAQPLLYRKN
ncbi:acyltransferase family protein [Alkalibacillus haloalkaliphilus]|uniref:acyltransferase family protein n=1 Tax=Alkalibacillus haloalkaliphilus TaxID=94136 RepID=UPI000311B3D2|nr:acyltransferase family protein [Alkalibacillus haloalkaliphilus]